MKTKFLLMITLVVSFMLLGIPSIYADGLTIGNGSAPASLLLLLSDEGTPPSCPAIPNGNFESGAVSWTEYSANGWDIIDQWTIVPSHSGSWYAWLGGDYDETAYITQDVTVPSVCPYLVFYHWIGSSDVCGYDYGYVNINGTPVETLELCIANDTNGWVKKVINLSGYANQTVSLQIQVLTDSSVNSNWFIDDVSFQESASAGLVTNLVPLRVDSATQPKSE